MERWLMRDVEVMMSGSKPHFNVASRSLVRQKTDLALRLLLKAQTDTGNSQEEDAALLREVARLCQSAAWARVMNWAAARFSER